MLIRLTINAGTALFGMYRIPDDDPAPDAVRVGERTFKLRVISGMDEHGEWQHTPVKALGNLVYDECSVMEIVTGRIDAGGQDANPAKG